MTLSTTPIASMSLMPSTLTSNGWVPGKVSPETGRAALEALEVATQMVLGSKADALVTAPVHKAAAHQAGFPFPRTYGIFSGKGRGKKTRLMLLSDPLRVIHVTGHMALKDAITALTDGGIGDRGLDLVECRTPPFRRRRFEPPCRRRRGFQGRG